MVGRRLAFLLGSDQFSGVNSDSLLNFAPGGSASWWSRFLPPQVLCHEPPKTNGENLKPSTRLEKWDLPFWGLQNPNCSHPKKRGNSRMSNFPTQIITMKQQKMLRYTFFLGETFVGCINFLSRFFGWMSRFSIGTHNWFQVCVWCMIYTWIFLGKL